MTLWAVPTGTNIFEEELIVKIEAARVDIRKLKLQGISARGLVDSADAHIAQLQETLGYLKRKAKCVSLNELRNIKKSMASLQKDAHTLRERLNAIQKQISEIEKHVEALYAQREVVSLKVLEFKKP